MTEKDKTGDQLMASIRKTKTTAAATRKKTTKRAPAKARVTETTVAPTAAEPPKPTAKPPVKQSPSDQPLMQFGRRVWPD